MSTFKICKAINGQFYATFQAANNEQVWKTGDEYVNKIDAINAIRILALSFNVFMVEFTDTTGTPNKVVKEVYFDGDKILKVKTVKNAKSSKRTGKN